MPKRIVFCGNCESAFSTENYPAGACPKCSMPLFETAMQAEEWKQKTAEEKLQIMASWKQNITIDLPLQQNPNSTGTQAAAPVVVNSSNEYYLAQIAQNTKATANWVKFWSILTLIGYALMLLGVISAASLL